MNKNKKWSILVWSIFLILFVSFSFVYISLKIQKNILKTNTDFVYNDKTSSQKLFNANSNWILKWNEELIFWIQTPTLSNVFIEDGWPIEFLAYSWSNITSSWIIYQDINHDLEIFKNLKLKNLGWVTNLNINFTNSTWVTIPYNYIKTNQDNNIKTFKRE